MKPSKRLGQHFLVDKNHAKHFVSLVRAEPDALCIEVGPGTGNLTTLLAERVPRLLAVELDHRRVAALTERCSAFPHVTITHGDILRCDPPGDEPLVLVGAIPYQITSPLLERCVAWKSRLRRAYFIVQREVAQRLAAAPGTPEWGRLTCLAQYHFTVKRHWDVPATAFAPRPKVVSSVIELATRAVSPVTVDEPFFFAMIAQLFQGRRKTLWNMLRSWTVLAGDEAHIRAALATARIAPTVRAETLGLPELAALAKSLHTARASTH